MFLFLYDPPTRSPLLLHLAALVVLDPVAALDEARGLVVGIACISFEEALGGPCLEHLSIQLGLLFHELGEPLGGDLHEDDVC
jgi:hypothetical protein